MHKLLNLMLLVTLIVTACFVTGCGNTDDDWKNPVSNEPVLTFTLGFTQPSIPSNSRADVGAIEAPKSVTVEGKPFRQTSGQNMVCFVGELPKTIIDFIRNQGYARMSLDFTSYTDFALATDLPSEMNLTSFFWRLLSSLSLSFIISIVLFVLLELTTKCKSYLSLIS